MNLRLVQEWYNGPEYKAKLQARMTRLKQCENEFVRERMIAEEFAVNPILFIETFCWTKLNKFNNELKPFFLFDYQKKIIQKLWESENDLNEHRIVIDKPREMGVTYTVLAYMYWRWLFTPNWSALLMSRNGAQVDDGTRLPDGSLFSKLRWFIDMTPKYLLPKGYTPKMKKGTSTDMEMKLVNPNLSGLIVGSSTNDSAGRSNRFSLTFTDEAFFIEHFMTVMNALNSVAKTHVLASSSVPGSTYQKFVDAQEARGDRIKLVVNDHPWKDEEWQKEKRLEGEWNPEALREIEVSYTVPKDVQYYPQISESLQEPIEYDPTLPVYVSMDVGRSDLTVLVWWQYKNSRFHIIDCYANRNRDLVWYAPFISSEYKGYDPTRYQGVTAQKLERCRRYKKPTYLFSGLDAKARKMPLNKSFEEVLYPLIKLKITVNNYAEKHEARRTATSQVLPFTTFNSENDDVNELYDSILNSEYVKADKATSKTTVNAPVHGSDGKADYRSAFEYGATNIIRVIRAQRGEKREEKFNDTMNGLVGYLRV